MPKFKTTLTLGVTVEHVLDIPDDELEGFDWVSAEPEVNEKARCLCGKRIFEVTDRAEGGTVRVHVGYLNPLDKAHNAVSEFLAVERSAS